MFVEVALTLPSVLNYKNQINSMRCFNKEVKKYFLTVLVSPSNHLQCYEQIISDLIVYFGLKQQYLYTIYVDTVKHYHIFFCIFIWQFCRAEKTWVFWKAF